MTKESTQSKIDPKLLTSGIDHFGDADLSTAYNRVWYNVLRSHRLILPQVQAVLKKSGIKDALWYDTIVEIERGGENGRLMGEVQAALHIPQHAMSRHITRLEAEDLVRREYISDGRRKQVLHLTEKSRGFGLEIWPANMQAIQDSVADKMTVEEAYLLTRLLIKLQV